MLLGAETEQNGSFRDINGVTRNKLYVACSKAKGNLTFIPEPLLKASKQSQHEPQPNFIRLKKASLL